MTPLLPTPWRRCQDALLWLTQSRPRREEREKLNVWVAYLNLENTYGSPPDEAVMKLFQRALQHVDQKKLYLALLTILESTKKVTATGSCLVKMGTGTSPGHHQ